MIRSALAALCLAPLALAQGQVLVVDDDAGPGVDFTDLQPAVDAAGSGDVLLVRTGDFGTFEVVGKSISILEAPGADARVLAPGGAVRSRIAQVPAGGEVFVRGLTVVAPSVVDDEFLALEDSVGRIVFEDFEILPPVPLPFQYQLLAGASVEVADCEEVVFVRSRIVGSGGAPQGFGLEAGSRALRSVDSHLFLFETELFPGVTLVLGGPGLSAASLDGGSLAARDCTIQGGSGGLGSIFGPGRGNGGPGLSITGGASVLAIGTTLIGGPGGQDSLGGGQVGQPGPPYSPDDADVTELSANAVELTFSSVVGDDPDARLEVQVTAEPSATLLGLVALSGHAVSFPALGEISGTGTNPILLPLGAADANGSFFLQAGTPFLPPGLEAFSLTLQVASLNAFGGLELSSPSRTTIVQSSFLP